MLLAQLLMKPRGIHAVILLVAGGLSAMVTAVLGPILPKMQQHFAGIANVDYLVPLSLTIPMLVMAFLCVFAGALSDRIGRKPLLVFATAGYALLGTAPLYLGSLASIFASRIGLGLMEAILMTLSTAMIGDYFHGSKREKYMSLQTTSAALLALTFNLVGGFLGEFGWRVPYSVYIIGLPLAALMGRYLWEPQRGEELIPVAAERQTLPIEFKPLLLTVICLLAFVCGFVFLIVPVHLAYFFESVGIRSSAQIGMAYGLNSLGVISGTLCFGWLIAPRLRVSLQIALCFALTAVSCLWLKSAVTFWGLTSAAMLNGIGAGLMLPTLVTWNMRELPPVKRGFGTGAYQSALYLGMFLNPVVIVWLEKQLGSRGVAVGSVGTAMFLAALLIAAPSSHLKSKSRHRPPVSDP